MMKIEEKDRLLWFNKRDQGPSAMGFNSGNMKMD